MYYNVFNWVTIVYTSYFFAYDPRYYTPSIEAGYVHRGRKLVHHRIRSQSDIYNKDKRVF